MSNNQYRVMGASLGLIKGTHQMYVRPETISATDSEVDTLFENTRGFSQVTAPNIARSNITSVTASSAVKAQMRNNTRWSDDRSFAVILVDEVAGRNVRRYMVSFYIPRDAVVNDVVDPDAILHINSCTEVELGQSRLRQVQTDLVQRLGDSGSESIIPNRVVDRLSSVPHATGGEAHLNIGSSVVRSRSVVGDASTLVADDALASTLKAMDATSRTLGARSTALLRNEPTVMESVCDGAVVHQRERDKGENELIRYLMDGGNGSEKYMSISIDNLQRKLGSFDFTIIKSEAGNKDYQQTSELDTLTGAMGQSIANQIIGIMIRRSINYVRFFATNVSGRVEITVPENWLVAIRTKDVEGIDHDTYMNQLFQTEATIKSELENLILPKLMQRPNMEVLVDIALLTTATVKMNFDGTDSEFSMQCSTASAWTSINTSEGQLAGNSLAQKNILRRVLENVQAQSDDHLGHDR